MNEFIFVQIHQSEVPSFRNLVDVGDPEGLDGITLTSALTDDYVLAACSLRYLTIPSTTRLPVVVPVDGCSVFMWLGLTRTGLPTGSAWAASTIPRAATAMSGGFSPLTIATLLNNASENPMLCHYSNEPFLTPTANSQCKPPCTIACSH